MAFVNEITLDAQSVREILPVNVTMTMIPTSPDTNAVDSAKRYDLADPADTGVDISAKTGVSTNVLSVNDLFTRTGGDDPAVGSYRVRVVVKNAAGTRKEEVNLLVEVVA